LAQPIASTVSGAAMSSAMIVATTAIVSPALAPLFMTTAAAFFRPSGFACAMAVASGCSSAVSASGDVSPAARPTMLSHDSRSSSAGASAGASESGR
jgi:hypothetical protein